MVKTIKVTNETHFILNKIKAEKRFKSFDEMFVDYFQIKEDVEGLSISKDKNAALKDVDTKEEVLNGNS